MSTLPATCQRIMAAKTDSIDFDEMLASSICHAGSVQSCLSTAIVSQIWLSNPVASILIAVIAVLALDKDLQQGNAWGSSAPNHVGRAATRSIVE
ncbi:MAG: hypothetical protein K2Y37_25750 [Pirellulales bacterium]|nr:hypothetical protein [Pirellulales bacterium]